MTNLNDKMTVIIRSVGERTEQLCRDLILAQGVLPANLVIVRESPFSTAMRKSFAIGLERGLPWTFCVDADVLLRPDSVAAMLQLAEAQSENVCEIQGYVLDKFFGGPRKAGNHLYRTSLLPEVITSIPDDGVNIRPEGHTLKTMARQGFPWVTVPYLVGLHDFEQYYQDIFRKCYVHAHKHLHHAELLVTLWRDDAASDFDYVVALQGFAQGITHYQEQVLIDASSQLYQNQFEKQGIQEKTALPAESYALADVEYILNSWIEPELYRRSFPTKLGLIVNKNQEDSFYLKTFSNLKRFQQIINEVGVGRSLLYAAGWILISGGNRFKRWADYPRK